MNILQTILQSITKCLWFLLATKGEENISPWVGISIFEEMGIGLSLDK